MERFSIVVPALNEEQRLPPMLERYGDYFETLRKRGILDYEIVVVVNSSTDNTLGVARNAGKKNSRIRSLDFKQRGKGFAIIQGFKDALTRPNVAIGFVDADMATPPEAFYDLVRALKDQDGIIAARWRRDSVVTKQTRLGRVKSFVFNFLVRSLFLFPYSDTQCGAKLFRRNAVSYVYDKMSITKWAFDIDLLYQLRKGGFLIGETSTIWENKEGTTIRLVKASLEMFLAVVRLRFIHSPFSFIVRAYDALPEQLKMHHRIWR